MLLFLNRDIPEISTEVTDPVSGFLRSNLRRRFVPILETDQSVF
jgi:hypothetical protein